MVEWINKLFGNEEDKRLYERNKELIDDNERLERSLAILREANKNIADRCVSLENKLELLEKDAEQYIEIETERRLMQLEDEYQDKMEHKWYGIGRQDAYREMGIRNIDAHRRGNVLVQDENGEIVELIQGLEDVDADIEIVKHLDMKVNPSDEIQINDLIGVKA